MVSFSTHSVSHQCNNCLLWCPFFFRNHNQDYRYCFQQLIHTDFRFTLYAVVKISATTRNNYRIFTSSQYKCIHFTQTPAITNPHPQLATVMLPSWTGTLQSAARQFRWAHAPSVKDVQLTSSINGNFTKHCFAPHAFTLERKSVEISPAHTFNL